jgi:prephenate dehydratase
LLPNPTIASLFAAIETGAVDRSVIPLSNSTNGPVNQTLDLIAASSLESDLEVCGETSVVVKHCLVGRRQSWNSESVTLNNEDGPGSDQDDLSHITSLHTHPQAWTQCSPFLERHFDKSISRVDEDSTSAAAELVSRDATGRSAAICSALAADLLGLDVLARDIQETTNNQTRFLVLRQKSGKGDGTLSRKTAPEQTSKDRQLIVFRISTSEEQFQAIVRKVAAQRQMAVFVRPGPWNKEKWIYLFMNNSALQESYMPAVLTSTTRSSGESIETWSWGEWTETTAKLDKS